MLNLIEKYRQRARERKPAFSKEHSVLHFLTRDDHAWITAHPGIQKSFRKLFTLLPFTLVEELVKNPVCFVRAETFHARGAGAYRARNTVVVFPEYQQLLEEGDGAGVAFLAHEIALVLYEWSNPEDKDPMMAEVEADKFVCDLGLADDLEQLLLAMDESTDKRMRLTYLTLNAFGLN